MFRKIMILAFVSVLAVSTAQAASKVYQITEGSATHSLPIIGEGKIAFSTYNTSTRTTTLNNYDLSNDVQTSFNSDFGASEDSRFFHSCNNKDKNCYVWVEPDGKLCYASSLYPNKKCMDVGSITDGWQQISLAGGYLTWVIKQNGTVLVNVVKLEDINQGDFNSKVKSKRVFSGNIDLISVISVLNDKKLIVIVSAKVDMMSKNMVLEFNDEFLTSNPLNVPFFIKGYDGKRLVGLGWNSPNYSFYYCDFDVNQMVCQPQLLETISYYLSSDRMIISNGIVGWKKSTGGLQIYDLNSKKYLKRNFSTDNFFDIKDGQLVFLKNGHIYYQDLLNSRAKYLGLRVRDLENTMNNRQF